MLQDYELCYINKQKEEDVLALTPCCDLKAIGDFGTPRLLTESSWSNMLIFGDNLTVLKSLMINSVIRTNVRLVYIDPLSLQTKTLKAGIHVLPQ